MNEREQRGLHIAALSKIKHKGRAWFVPSQSGNGEYKVNVDSEKPNCTCPDFESHREKCKHIYAVEFTLQRESGTKPARPQTDIPLRAKKVYSQDWPAYRMAQTTEKAKFQQLLYELCSGIDEPIKILGRPRLPVADQMFATAYKVYSTFSSRRFMTDLEDAYARRFISKRPCYNSVNNYMEMEELTPYLKILISHSCLPLKAIETAFAVDSSGFSTSKYVRWYNYKYEQEETERDWVKAHVMCGVKTNIVTAVEVSGAYDHDTNFFAPVVNETARNFQIEEVSADKAYSSFANMRLLDVKNATPYIAFKINSTDKGRCEIWNKMYHYYSLRREEFLQHYHQRSNVETTFSMVKAKFGGFVRSKVPAAQVNEVLCKILCHNICCLIQSSYELGVQAVFWLD